MKRIILTLIFSSLFIVIAISILAQKEYEPTQLMDLREQYSKSSEPLADHSQYPILQQAFNNPREVTEACVSCHNKTAQYIMDGNHWNWEREEYIQGRGIVYLGKKNALNNFCIGTRGNEKSCAKCHIGYGMDDSGEIFVDEKNIDCLVCHDNTETYMKATEEGGLPTKTTDYNKIAQSVGRPQRSNCGVCHFFGGGGNNVKHGDLDMEMFYPSKDIDIHMATDGVNLQCVDCHETHLHSISGKVYSLSSMNLNRNKCEDCHTELPHESNILNEHSIKVSCQACHIPRYAKGNSTKMYWDWSTAGKLHNGEPFSEEDSLGNHTYLSIKGSFKWANDVKPEYIWFNGTASHYLKGDVIQDTSEVLVLNKLQGSYSDEESKIIPAKVHLANQPFDPINKILIQPKLYSDNKGEGAFWKDFDWQTAAKKGMAESDLPFSGKISFIETAMYWPINHMVSPKEESVKCVECHTRDNSLLAGLTDFYVPGRDHYEPIEIIGKWLIIFALLGVFIHSGIRIYAFRQTSKRG